MADHPEEEEKNEKLSTLSEQILGLTHKIHDLTTELAGRRIELRMRLSQLQPGWTTIEL